jgi:hypothetical protein
LVETDWRELAGWKSERSKRAIEITRERSLEGFPLGEVTVMMEPLAAAWKLILSSLTSPESLSSSLVADA